MSLAAGSKLGPYEILAPIGAGGMGEVYRARDSKLKRDVALKVLPDSFAADPERMARFQREAEVLASLNHPNIAQIYGVEERALVMELVPGESLKGPLPLETAVNYAKQIADALEAAHEKGIVHRDLKPANIMITPEGVVKVLDFGLAALPNRDREGADPANSPTMTISPTRAGMILGTAAYMSPEQARGRAVDKRADIWAFGVVLYEMLTGKRLFDGETISDILAQVLTKEPDVTQVPGKMRRLLEACLQKDPKQRLQAIGDWRLLLMDVQPQVIAPLALNRASRSRLGWIAAAVLAVVAVALGFVAYRATRPAPLKPLVRLDVDLGPDVSLNSLAGTDTILSPEGTRLVYASRGRLYTRRLDQPKATELAGTDGAFEPFFSPDGQWVAFFASGKLKKISLEGGAPIALCDYSNPPRGGSWGEDGTIIAALGNYDSLSRIPSTGGASALVTQLAQGEATQRWPQILLGGKAVLFTSHTTAAGFDGANIEVMTLADHRRKTLQRGGTFGRYLPAANGTGHLIYINKGTMFAVSFDLEKLEVRGTPSLVLDEVAYSSAFGSARFDFSRNGTLVYRSGGVSQGDLVTVQWLDAAGKTQPLLAKPGVYERPRLSPDGERLVFGDGSDLWVYETRRDAMTRLTFDGTKNITPLWSPDGRYIVFSWDGGLWWIRSDAAGKPEPLIKSNNSLFAFSFAPDGKRLAYSELSPTTSYDILTAPIESDGAGLRAGKPEIFLQTSADERNATFSSDGRWLAYTSNESGKYEVYVRAFPDKGGRWQISNAGGAYPMWSPNGQELFFRADDNRIMVAPYAAKADSFVSGKPRVWSDKRLADFGTIGFSNYDVAPDGKRIVALMPVDTPEAQQTQSHVIFLMNFFDELQRRVPVEGK